MGHDKRLGKLWLEKEQDTRQRPVDTMRWLGKRRQVADTPDRDMSAQAPGPSVKGCRARPVGTLIRLMFGATPVVETFSCGTHQPERTECCALPCLRPIYTPAHLEE